MNIKLLQVIFYFCSYTCELFSFYPNKIWFFSIIIVPVMDFPSECTAKHHLNSTLSISGSLGCFNVRHFRSFFTLLLYVTNDCTWSSCFFMSQRVHDPMLYEAKVTPSFAALKPPNFFKFLRNHSCSLFPPASSTMFTQLWTFCSHYNRSMGSVKSTQHNKEFMESVFVFVLISIQLAIHVTSDTLKYNTVQHTVLSH